MVRIDVLMKVVELFLRGVNQEPDRGGKRLAVGVTNYVGRIYGAIFKHAGGNYVREASTVLGYMHSIMDRVKGRGDNEGVPPV